MVGYLMSTSRVYFFEFRNHLTKKRAKAPNARLPSFRINRSLV